MSYEYYVFGSITRGEVTQNSDVDILAIPLIDNSVDRCPSQWSCYSLESIKRMYQEGRLFAWHLFLDSQCIYTPHTAPLLVGLGKPKHYSTAIEDINNLKVILKSALSLLADGTENEIYEIGLVHTCLRDIAMTASWHMNDRPIFSINAPYLIGAVPPISLDVYIECSKARHSSTRGIDIDLNVTNIIKNLLIANLLDWVDSIKSKINE
ncbi:hypothetical protein PsalN5692_04118 (plasmid) [Piscirickettsia salmonis]|uniref:nucleotidyltransferase domain-containing protein n=2 Tax=Piscirickettsia salmonis TaxID=1238 RepID=UPI0012B8333E|nr:nucleotidyltransferase domain-containing protein [Piscirickettsia salmonis]QGP52609.1 hypothetical protein PsalN5692_04118 [Piscirickettsia salmonis]